jgi:hypothetical protein
MKKFFLLFTLCLTGFIIVLSSCDNKDTVLPCDNKGTIYIVNKLDTNVTVSITQLHNTFVVHKDENSSVQLLADQAYTFTFSSINYQMDTTFYLSPCDNFLLTVKQ